MSQVINSDITTKKGEDDMSELDIFNTKKDDLVLKQVEMAIFTGMFITRDDGEYDFFATPGVKNIDRMLGLYQRSLPPEKASGPRPQILGLTMFNADMENKRVFISIPDGNLYMIAVSIEKGRLQKAVQRQLPTGWRAILYV